MEHSRQILLTDGNHLQMPGLHLLLKHRGVRHDLFEVLDIVGAVNDLASAIFISIISLEKEHTTYAVVPGARLKLSRVRPIRVHFDSFEGS